MDMTLRITCSPARAQEIANALEDQQTVTVEYGIYSDGIAIAPYSAEHGPAFLRLLGQLASIARAAD